MSQPPDPNDPTRGPGPAPAEPGDPASGAPAPAGRAGDRGRAPEAAPSGGRSGDGPTPASTRRSSRKEEVDEVKDGGARTAGLWIALVLGAIVLVLLLIFVIQNNVSTQFQYFGATFSLPLGGAMLLSAIAGALVMALVGSVRMIQMSWTIRKLRKNEKKIRSTIEG